MDDVELSLKIKRVIRGVRVEAEVFVPAMNIKITADGKSRIYSVKEFKSTMNDIDIKDSMFAMLYNDMLEVSEILNHELSTA